MVPQGTSRSINWTRIQVMKNADSNASTDIEANDAFINSLLSMTESKCNDDFF